LFPRSSTSQIAENWITRRLGTRQKVPARPTLQKSSTMPSPSKKARLGTAEIPPTPPLSAPRSSSASVSIDSLAAALPEPSRQSALRFFATLSTLPSKYSLNEEDDDIVDFETDSIIPGKKGLLTRSNTEWKFGCFAPPRTEDTDLGIPEETGTDPFTAEDEEDELDLIKPRSPSKPPEKYSRDNSVHLPEPSALHLPPLDPANNAQDAEDLQEFLQVNALRNKAFQEAVPEARNEEGDDEYCEVFEDSEIPVVDDEDKPRSILDDEDEDEDSDDMGGYDAGEGSIIRNTDGTIRSIPTPSSRSPSRARSRSVSVKPIHNQLIHSPIKQPVFVPSPRTSTPNATLHSSNRSSPRRDSISQQSENSPPPSPLKDIRIRSRRPSRTHFVPPSTDISDPFLRPSTPPPLKTKKASRPHSPEVLPPPPTPPKRSTQVNSTPTPSRSSKARVDSRRANSLSPPTRSHKSQDFTIEPDDYSRSPVSRNTRSQSSQKGKVPVHEFTNAGSYYDQKAKNKLVPPVSHPQALNVVYQCLIVSQV
jgi:hypothetical protein